MAREWISSESELEERLSRPTPGTIDALGKLDGDLLILGVGGKMGPSLARLARRSADAAGRTDLRVIGVSRFTDLRVRQQLEQAGVQTMACDLLDRSARQALPQVPNVVFMFGHKFGGGATAAPGTYWTMNTCLPALLAEQYRDSRIVCFSSGNVYPFTPLGQPAPTEQSPCGPVGEYAITVWGRERVLEYASAQYGTPVCLVRLNYAAELRYGVPVDLAQAILARRTIDLAVPELNFVWQGYANQVALRCFDLASSPPAVLNVTGPQRHRVRDLAARLGELLGLEPLLRGPEGHSSLLSDATRCHQLFGLPDIDSDRLIGLVAGWLKSGRRTWSKPTKFHVRNGRY